MNNVQHEKNNSRAKAIDAIKNYEAQLKNMRQMLALNKISPEDFGEFKREINPQMEELKNRDVDVVEVESELKRYLKKGIQLVKNVRQVYDLAALNEKQKLIRSIFKENIVFENNAVRTGMLNEALALIGLFDKGSKGNKKKTEGENHLQSQEVAGTGLEPMTFGL